MIYIPAKRARLFQLDLTRKVEVGVRDAGSLIDRCRWAAGPWLCGELQRYFTIGVADFSTVDTVDTGRLRDVYWGFE